MHKEPAAWFFVVDFLVKLCSHDSFKHILRLFWVGKKCYVLLECLETCGISTISGDKK